MPSPDLQSAIKAALENGARLAEDATLLAEWDRIPTAFFISVLAREEFAKAFMLILAQSENLAWTTKLQKSLRNHVCKQLISHILCELSAIDLFDPAHLNKWPRRVRDLPTSVVDAFHILVHEHIRGRDREDWWDREQDTPIDPTVHEVAAGAVEKKKQDALYVRYGWNGSVKSVPARRIAPSEWTREYRSLEQIKDAFWVSEGRLSGSPSAQYDVIAALVRVLAGLMSPEEFNRDWW
jgi:AbiV family abortive infection protein